MSEYLRPVKWRNAVRRRVFRHRLSHALHPTGRVRTTYLGTEFGGWPVPLGALDSDAVAYSVGAGGDVSFDVELLRRVGCEVHSFDPSPGAARHVAQVGEPRLAFHPVAIWLYDGVVEMFTAASPDNMALSIPNLQNTRTSVTVPCRSIESIRHELGHEHIDLIKLTVDGCEYKLIPTLDLDGWGTRVLVVAFQHNEPATRALALVKELSARGYEPVARKGATGFTFYRPARARPPRGEPLPLASSAPAPRSRRACRRAAAGRRGARRTPGTPAAP
jgi:FkbM family methyltransferase